jgi:hypothetical protein
LRLSDRQPLQRDGRWSRSTGCYQLKAAMGWYELSEAAGDTEFRRCYDAVLEYSLRTYGSFLPGHSERAKVMDRLHAFCYFLEGLLPAASDRRCAAALCDGIRRVAEYLREIGPEFDRSDVYAQLLRARLFADQAGAVPLDRAAARWEADQLRGFQHAAGDPRVDGGFCFGRKAGEWLPFVNPVSTAFALQALAMWEQAEAGSARYERHSLI